MFAGRNFKKREMVMAGDIIIPIVELAWHNGHESLAFLWDEYTWSHSVAGDMEYETEGGDLYAASTGIGAAINCMLPLVNVEDSSSKCDNADLHRLADPGSGAFTPYYDRKAMSIKDILEGEELFIDYGDNYFSSRKDTYGLLPLTGDFPKADKLLRKYQRLRDATLAEASLQLQTDLWKIITNFGMESRVINALPSSQELVDELAEIGTGMQHKARSRRTLEWLNEHGQCMDNIKPALSGINQAGRGVFASRSIGKGALVAPAPLIHIPNRSVLIMYDSLPVSDNGMLERNVSTPNHAQLMINYCFGHPESSLLLSPYGSLTSLINHSPTPNTRIQWSKTMRHPEWLKQDPLTLDDEWHSGLSFDFIALRDIVKDEEITIDYGSDWQDTWDNHVKNWVPPKGADMYQAAYELNRQEDLVIKTIHEGPYSDSLLLWIRGFYMPQEDASDYYRVFVLDRFTCHGETLYTVAVFTTKDIERQTTIEYVGGILFALPRDAFVFDDVPYTRDHQMTWSFRHDMKIPDDMMPEAWKNLKHGKILA